jgi:hypothetical protein
MFLVMQFLTDTAYSSTIEGSRNAIGKQVTAIILVAVKLSTPASIKAIPFTLSLCIKSILHIIGNVSG